MRHARSFAIATALLFAPPLITASFAQSSGGGSDVPPATARAAVAGPVANGTMGSQNNLSVSPTSGTSGGGMSTKSGMKVGGQDHSPVKKNGSVIAAP